MKKDRDIYNGSDDSVYTCCYDPKLGRWRYLKYNTSNKCDDIKKIMTILEYLSGEISLSELSFCIPYINHYDRYQSISQRAQLNVLKSLNLK